MEDGEVPAGALNIGPIALVVRPRGCRWREVAGHGIVPARGKRVADRAAVLAADENAKAQLSLLLRERSRARRKSPMVNSIFSIGHLSGILSKLA